MVASPFRIQNILCLSLNKIIFTMLYCLWIYISKTKTCLFNTIENLFHEPLYHFEPNIYLELYSLAFFLNISSGNRNKDKIFNSYRFGHIIPYSLNEKAWDQSTNIQVNIYPMLWLFF